MRVFLSGMSVLYRGVVRARLSLFRKKGSVVRYKLDARQPLRSLVVERERDRHGVAVGRKNHYGSRSERGTPVAALFYSLIESAKLCGVEPRGYLREATLRAVRNPGAATLARELNSPES